MPKDVIGSAYVRIVAMSQDFEKQVQASFDRLKPMAEKSGEESSKAWTDAFNKHFGQSMADAHERTMADLADEWGKTDHGEIYGDRVGDGMHERLIARQRETADALGSQWSTAGGEHGSTYADPIATSIENALAKAIENTSNLWRGSHLMDSPLSDIKKLEDEIERGLPASGRRGSVGFGQAFSNVFDSLGREISALFSSIGGDRGGNSRIFKSLTDGADQASRAFTMLFGIGQLLGSGLTVLVAGISNVVAGIFALGSAAASAAPALAASLGCSLPSSRPEPGSSPRSAASERLSRPDSRLPPRRSAVRPRQPVSMRQPSGPSRTPPARSLRPSALRRPRRRISPTRRRTSTTRTRRARSSSATSSTPPRTRRSRRSDRRSTSPTRVTSSPRSRPPTRPTLAPSRRPSSRTRRPTSPTARRARATRTRARRPTTPPRRASRGRRPSSPPRSV